MINTLIKSFQIDCSYTINSYIYLLSKLPIFKDLFTEDIYNSKLLKNIIGFISLIINITKEFLVKNSYYLIIYMLSIKYFPNNSLKVFIHMLFCLTLLGTFINNKLLNTNKKHYFSIILFNIDSVKYFRTNLLWNTIKNIFFNTICLYIIFNKLLLSNNIMYLIIFILLIIFSRFIGELLNINFFRKYHYMWYTNKKIYFSVILLFLGITLLPFINIIFTLTIIQYILLIIMIIGTISFIKLLNIKDYKLLYKRLLSITNVMNSENQKDYLYQAMIDVRKKDKEIDDKILENKHGYDLFNTIFFERHKHILLRSAKKYTLIIIGIYLFLIYLMLTYSNYNKNIAELLHLKLAIFIIVMFFVNRGAIITRAMFYNCDHAMLNYNFYRNKKVILELFKKRLLIVAKVNLIPAITIGVGNTILMLISKNQYSIETLITSFLFIISLSILFSIHYLVIYYLLQPFNKNMQAKKMSYTIVTLITYFLTYYVSDIILPSEILSLFGIIIVIIYIIVALLLVYTIAPKTFKLN